MVSAGAEGGGARLPPASLLDTFALLRGGEGAGWLEGGVRLLGALQRHREDDANLQYSLKRIIRSLGANQLGMRTGYFSTLVLLLKKFEQITVTQLLKLVKQELHAGASTKSEVGDVSVGRLLVCGAIFRSGLMMKATEQEQQEVLTLLFSAGTKKSYLNSACYLLLVDFVESLDADQFKSVVWSHVKPQLKKPLQDHTLDSLYFLLKVREKFPGAVKVNKLLGVEDVVCEDSIHTLSEKLMNVTDMNQTNHPIYPVIGTIVANSEHLKLFWSSGIDSQLTKHNRNRELVAINLLTNILNSIESNHEVIPDLLSKNFFKLFLDWFKGLQTASKIRQMRDDEDDNKMMIKKEKDILNALAKAVKSEAASNCVKVEVLKKLLFYPGDMNLTEITSTAVVKSIMSSLEKDGVKKMAKLFRGVLLNESKKFIKDDTERPWFNYERVKASDYLSHLVTHPAVLEDSSFRLTYMKLLMCFGFFKIAGSENGVISEELSGSIKTSFYRCLNSRLPTVDSLADILRSLCNFIEENLSNEKIKEKLMKQFPEENMECWATLKRICDKIESNTNKKKIDNVFLILLYQLGLFLFAEPKYVDMAKSAVTELASCYEHYKKDTKKKPRKVKEGELYEGEPEWIEVLVEVLLQILSSESSVLRSVVQCAFRLLWEHLTPSSIGQIVSILDPDSDSNPLVQDDSDSDDDSDVDDEKVKGNGKSEGSDSGNDSDSQNDASDTEIEDDEDDDKMKIPDQLRMAVQKALGSAAPDTDTESIDADMIDEEEGKKLDMALSEAFKLLNQGKKVSKKDRKDKKILTDFRIRVLDLVDIYLEKEPAMDICLGMLAPLMRCLEFCIQDNEQRELESRVRKTLKMLTNVKKFSSTEDVTEELLCDYLKATIEKGSRTHFIFQALGDMVTQCGTFIVQCSQKIDAAKTPSKKKKRESPIVAIYKESLESFFQNRNCLLPIIFFHKILQIDWVGNYTLVPIIISNAFNSNVRQFRRHEALELLVGFYMALKRLKPENVVEILRPIDVNFVETIKTSLNTDNDDFVVKDQFYKLLKKVISNIEKYYVSVGEKCPVDSKELEMVLVRSKTGMKGKREKNESEEKQKAPVQIPVQERKAGKKTKKKRKGKPDSSLEPKQKKTKT